MNYLNKALFKNAGVIHLRDLVNWRGAEERTSELEDISKIEKQREQNLKKTKKTTKKS